MYKMFKMFKMYKMFKSCNYLYLYFFKLINIEKKLKAFQNSLETTLKKIWEKFNIEKKKNK